MCIRDRDGTVEAVHGFRGEEWFFKGHFPQRPIVPGVIICEIMAQACCGLFSESMEGKIPYLVKIKNAVFRRPVTAGENMTVKARATRDRPPLWSAVCEAYVKGELCACAELSFAIREAEAHKPRENGGGWMFEKLAAVIAEQKGLQASKIRMDSTLEELGAVSYTHLAMGIIDTALAVMNTMCTFDETAVMESAAGMDQRHDGGWSVAGAGRYNTNIPADERGR